MTDEKVSEFKDIDLPQLEANRDSDALSRLMDLWESKIRSTDAALQIVNEDMTIQSKELVELRNKLSQKRQEQLDTEQTVRKGLHTLRELKSQLKTIERSFWRCRG